MKTFIRDTSHYLFAQLMLGIVAVTSCSNGDDSPPIVEESGGTTLSASAVKLLTNLQSNSKNGNTLIGHQATTLAGVGWRRHQMPNCSDFKEITGNFMPYTVRNSLRARIIKIKPMTMFILMLL